MMKTKHKSLPALLTIATGAILTLSASVYVWAADAQDNMDHSMHKMHQMQSADISADAHAGHMKPESAVDKRTVVEFPAPMRTQTLSNMREHLLVMGEIQLALSALDFDKASKLAENRIGMSAVRAHGAHESSKFMPQGMHEIGAQMHKSASQFAVVAQEASVTGDLKPVLAALAKVNQTCVACHAGYQLSTNTK